MDKYQKIVFGFIICIAIGMMALVNIDVSGHEMEFRENEIRIRETYIKVEDITSVELLDEIYIGSKVKGASTATYLRGTFVVDDNQSGKVYTYHDSIPYIKITTNEKVVVYNDKESSKTVETYENILKEYNVEGIDITGNNTGLVTKEEHESQSNKVVMAITMIPLITVFGGMAIYSFKSDSPVHFWAGSVVRKDEISDTKGYNRANGIMWIVSLISFIIYIVVISKLEGLGIIISAILPIIIIVSMIICYQRIYNKYKVK